MSPVKTADRELEEQRPEPERLWVRYRPRRWPTPAARWCDLARGRLGGPDASGGPPTGSMEHPLEDLLYLPPVDEKWVGERDHIARRHALRGTPVLVQVLPGQSAPLPPAATCFDPLPALLRASWEGAMAPPGRGGGAVWPLLPGVSDDPDRFAEVCAAWRRRGVEWVHVVVPELDPKERRDLSEELGEAAFDALFHAAAPDRRPFCRLAHAAGLEPFAPRLVPRAPLRGAGNLHLAGQLGLAADLGARLGEPESRVQELYRAARWVESAPWDVRALAREGNLPAIPFVEGVSRELVSTAATEQGDPPPLADLRCRYLEEA